MINFLHVLKLCLKFLYVIKYLLETEIGENSSTSLIEQFNNKMNGTANPVD
jgi:hypothetical protein